MRRERSNSLRRNRGDLYGRVLDERHDCSAGQRREIEDRVLLKERFNEFKVGWFEADRA